MRTFEPSPGSHVATTSGTVPGALAEALASTSASSLVGAFASSDVAST